MATISEALAIAIQHHQSGRLQAAEQIYRQILAVDPNQADAIHLLGVIAFQSGNHQLAVQLIGRAIQLQGNAAFYHNNLGEAYRAMGQLAEATACYRRALQLMPSYVEAHNNLGVVLSSQGKPDEAAACCRRALALKPDCIEAHNNLGNALKDQGKLDEAVASYRRTLALRPDYAEAHNNLGNALRDQGKLDEAAACCRRALELKPGYVEALNNLGNVLKDQAKLEEAVACYHQALALRPDYAAAHCNLGVALQQQGNLDKAGECYRRAAALNANFAEAHCNLGNILKEQGKFDEAAACYQRALVLRPAYVDALNNLGNTLKDQGKLDEAIACHRRALELKPDYAEVYGNLGLALEDQGKLDEAIACHRRALELKPDYAGAHYNLGSTLEKVGDFQGAVASLRAALRVDGRFAFAHAKLAELLGGKLPDEDLAAQRRLLEETGLTGVQRSLLHFGLARVMDARGEYAKAAGRLRQANALQLADWRARGQEYDPQEHERCITLMIEACTPEFFARVRSFALEQLGPEADLPVFVVGLPRSGTTLIEQILASHSQIYGAGEIKLAEGTMLALGGSGVEPMEGLRCLDRETARRLALRHLGKLRALSPTATRIVDKMPDNYLFLGLLAALFPRATFIHCRRDLRDVAVSCWMTHFREVRWANDQRHIASRFHDYQRIMEHWRKVLPVPLLEVDYEETVANLEGVARRLVSRCGLPWEAKCLEFHRTKRPVRTASAAQVRQPLYATSVARWRHYEQALAELLTALRGENDSPDSCSAGYGPATTLPQSPADSPTGSLVG